MRVKTPSGYQINNYTIKRMIQRKIHPELIDRFILESNQNNSHLKKLKLGYPINYIIGYKFFFDCKIFKPCLTIALFKPTKGTTSQTVPNETKSK